jgi:hypothetical protein
MTATTTTEEGKCKTCGQNHNPVKIGLEHGGFIIFPASAISPKFNHKSDTKPKPKVQKHILTPDIFWPEEEEIL